MPNLFFPKTGKLGLNDYEKVFCAVQETNKDIFEMRQIDRKNGCLVVLRPDQYVANILPLDALDGLSEFFDGVFDV